MSAASAILDAGLQSLTAFHGESLTWHPASVVLKRENGEAIPTELGKAIVTDESQSITFTGIFDESYASLNPIDGTIASTGPAVIASESDLPDAAQGDLILRSSVQYSVTDAQPDGLGMVVLILSKHAH